MVAVCAACLHSFPLAVWNTSQPSALIYSTERRREGGESVTTTTQWLESREGRREEGREAQKQRRESEGLNLLACRAHQMSDPPWKKKVHSSTSVSLEHTCKQKCHQLSVRKSDHIKSHFFCIWTLHSIKISCPLLFYSNILVVHTGLYVVLTSYKDGYSFWVWKMKPSWHCLKPTLF